MYISSVCSDLAYTLSSSLDPLSRELEHLLERLRGLPPPHALCGHSRRWSVRRCSGAGLVGHRCSGRGGPRLGPSTSSLRLDMDEETLGDGERGAAMADGGDGATRDDDDDESVEAVGYGW